ncbi:MAG: single-stranded DNA-binding protein [Chitinophagaceae bacterium]
MIKLQVIGNLGKDCLVNSVNGKNVINFNVAHTEKYKDSQGNQNEKTTWVECAYWTDKTAIAPYLKKGTMVFAEGTPEVRQYTRNDGTSGSSLSLRVVNVQLLGQRPEGGGNGAPQANNYSNDNGQQQPAHQPQQNNYSSVPAANEVTEPIDDLPF